MLVMPIAPTRSGDRVAIACCGRSREASACGGRRGYPASTGVIGVELETSLIHQRPAGFGARSAPNRFEDVRRDAILTTGHASENYASASTASNAAWFGCGLYQRRGPSLSNMATTLGFVMIDAPFRRPLCRASWRQAFAPATTGSAWTATRPPTILCCCLPTARTGIQPNEKERKKVAEAISGSLQDLLARLCGTAKARAS